MTPPSWTPAARGAPVAELVRWSWVEDNLDDIQRASIEHLQLVGASLGLAIAISIPVAILVRRRRIPFIAVNTISGALYTIPSLAMFAFLLSFVGIGFEPAVIALAVYCLQLIIRNAVVGLEGVSGPVREAATGMGLTRRQTLARVELPLALPAIVAGIRLAAVSTVGIATIAVYIGAGGLGVLIVNDGIQRGLFVTPIVVGAVIATVMAIVIDLALIGLERALAPWERARGGAG
jgi:osmoprotectant transport system permease protein